MAKQMELDLDVKETKHDGPVTCLGMEFSNDEARRVYFVGLLREKLKDLEFRQIEGFPIGEDENILALSDPPYYTACPNPWIGEFINEWEMEKPEKPEGYHYHREPFAADVSEGKNDPIYNAHSYHTKVPHKAIMRYILHYTEPGDIVFDGFCGTGMTGVAAQMCGDQATVESLGYQVKRDGIILEKQVNESGKLVWSPFAKLGARKTVLNDLSPAATFIANNYNTPVDVQEFAKEAKSIFSEVEDECGWMYETLHTDEKTKGKMNYTVWSDVFVCPECAGEVVFWDAVVDKEDKKVRNVFPCPHCQAELTKRKMERAWTTKYDYALKVSVKQAKQVPVLINYSVIGSKGRFEKVPDKFDLRLIEKIESSEIPYWFPTKHLPDGYNTRQPMLSHGFTHVHHFYTKRNLWVLSACWDRLSKVGTRFPFIFTASQRILSKMASIAFSYFFHGGGGFVNAGTKGTLYVSSTNPEGSVFNSLKSRLKSLLFQFEANKSNVCIENKSATYKSFLSEESIDYIFIDPPFGANIMYSELNFLWEPWLKVWTNNADEAIENKNQGKTLNEYRQLMTYSFKEAYRVLKPGHWMTVEFSNTKASVWNNIQTAITDAGFVVSNVSALDKKQGSFKAYTTPTAVKQDLVISAYKPNGGFKKRFKSEATSEEGVWEFVRTHLKYLPVIKESGAYYNMKKATAGDEAVANIKPLLETVPERDPRILYDQVVSYYVRNNFSVPISSPEFQQGLERHFIERDGMYFLPDQASKYDKKRILCDREEETLSLFVSDEASAIQWVHKTIDKNPQTFADLNLPFMQQLGGWKKNELQLDLRKLLHDNFLCYDGKESIPDQIGNSLSSSWKDQCKLEKDDPKLMAKAKDLWYVPDPNKAGDLEKLRKRSLLKEFEAYKQAKKKLKVFRLEAVRAGFKKAWQDKDFPTIIAVADKIPKKILEEDQKLLMWYDQAVTRIEG